METFFALLALCVGNSPVTSEFPSQRPVMRNFDVSFDLRLNIRFSKQSWSWWFETPSRPLWRHCNDMYLDMLSLVQLKRPYTCMAAEVYQTASIWWGKAVFVLRWYVQHYILISHKIFGTLLWAGYMGIHVICLLIFDRIAYLTSG